MKMISKSFSALLLAGCASVVLAAESYSVADLHAQRTDLGGREVSVTGTVIKVNNNIMRRNFVHVQDGTGSGDNDRIIVTSQQTAEVGDKVTATGIVKLDTDFGMGYFYPTLIEEASITAAGN
ncbi:hypothetical protein [Motiliproteus sp. SC1-56]|uniref:hypothetical protein n=1 Tax=Motiliproteus sp. SC1-56 TaxID=2799565 RepID=UPI001A8CA07F|nr:hypothetical protein [Motiliproteus sp. SC1-56]